MATGVTLIDLRPAIAAVALAGVLGTAACSSLQSATTAARVDIDWCVYGGRDGDRYSTLVQITRDNVRGLELAWRFDHAATAESQTQPLVVGRRLFGYTPDLDVIALDATIAFALP